MCICWVQNENPLNIGFFLQKTIFYENASKVFHIFYLSYFQYYKKAFLSTQNIVVFLIKWLDTILFFRIFDKQLFHKKCTQSLNLPAWFQYSEKFITYVCTDAYMIILYPVFGVIHKPCGHVGGSPKVYTIYYPGI